MNKWIEILKNSDFLATKKYIKEGGDVNESSESGESVLASALRYKTDFDLIMLLVENGADIHDFDNEGVTIFDMAVTYDNLDMVKFLIKQGFDVNTTKRRSRFSPLMAAVCYGRVDMVKFLIDQGADINAVDSKGISVYDFARKMNKKSILDILSSCHCGASLLEPKS